MNILPTADEILEQAKQYFPQDTNLTLFQEEDKVYVIPENENKPIKVVIENGGPCPYDSNYICEFVQCKQTDYELECRCTAKFEKYYVRVGSTGLKRGLTIRQCPKGKQIKDITNDLTFFKKYDIIYI